MIDRTDYVAAVGRWLIAVIFLVSGVGKIAAPTMTINYIASVGLPVPLVAYLVATIIEVGCGLLLVIGFQTRIVALILAVYTVATALSFHSDFANQNQMIHFLKNIAMTGGLLQVLAFGAGAFSIDNRRARSGGSISDGSASAA